MYIYGRTLRLLTTYVMVTLELVLHYRPSLTLFVSYILNSHPTLTITTQWIWNHRWCTPTLVTPILQRRLPRPILPHVV